jgi:hypothetical protein
MTSSPLPGRVAESWIEDACGTGTART